MIFSEARILIFTFHTESPNILGILDSLLSEILSFVVLLHTENAPGSKVQVSVHSFLQYSAVSLDTSLQAHKQAIAYIHVLFTLPDLNSVQPGPPRLLGKDNYALFCLHLT